MFGEFKEAGKPKTSTRQSVKFNNFAVPQRPHVLHVIIRLNKVCHQTTAHQGQFLCSKLI